ncbi:MAG: MarR family transcriptional regulator [Melioribacteraceae bacterium]|nr:MAG: MarR family transcriptional regulator [Melioribacteraceae bacterium]
MKLEEEIKQNTPFKDEFTKLAVNILYTHGWLSNLHAEVLKEHCITEQQYNILRILRGQHPSPASINLLKDRMLDKMSDASRLVDRLITKELVERKTCLNDRRKAEVIITEKGLKLLKALNKLEEAQRNIFKNLSIEEAKNLNDLLDKLRG